MTPYNEPQRAFIKRNIPNHPTIIYVGTMLKTYWVLNNRTNDVVASGSLDSVITDLKNLIAGVGIEKVLDLAVTATEEVEPSVEESICSDFAPSDDPILCSKCLWDYDSHQRRKARESLWDED